MREKLAIANQMRLSRKSFSNNVENQKLCSKCYHAYVIECIIKGNDNFKVSFGEKYTQSITIRIYDYYRYIVNILYKLFLTHFTPDDDKTFRKYKLIHFKIAKPLNFKIAEMPKEIVLYSFLEKNGFKIIDEHLNGKSKVYYVARA